MRHRHCEEKQINQTLIELGTAHRAINLNSAY